MLDKAINVFVKKATDRYLDLIADEILLSVYDNRDVLSKYFELVSIWTSQGNRDVEPLYNRLRAEIRRSIVSEK